MESLAMVDEHIYKYSENISAAIQFLLDICTHTDATLNNTAKMKNVLAILLGYL